MGNKVNTIAFRLINSKNFLSNWYAESKDYRRFIRKDFATRAYITKILSNFFTVFDIKIKRHTKTNKAKIYVYCILDTKCMPEKKELTLLFIKNAINIEFLPTEEKNIAAYEDLIVYLIGKLRLKAQKNINFKFIFTKHHLFNAKLIAIYLGNQFKSRIPHKKIQKQFAITVSNLPFLGVKYIISGRIEDVLKTRSLMKLHGQVKTQTITSKTDFGVHEIFTKAGVIGIKVWALEDMYKQI